MSNLSKLYDWKLREEAGMEDNPIDAACEKLEQARAIEARALENPRMLWRFSRQFTDPR
jgi:hypothetical protein